MNICGNPNRAKKTKPKFGKLHVEYIDTVNTVNDTVNDTINEAIFSLMKENNKISASQISAQLNISLSTVRRKIKELKDSGKITRLGSNKTGEWKIIV